VIQRAKRLVIDESSQLKFGSHGAGALHIPLFRMTGDYQAITSQTRPKQCHSIENSVSVFPVVQAAGNENIWPALQARLFQELLAFRRYGCEKPFRRCVVHYTQPRPDCREVMSEPLGRIM
jgi:hypothetical protein